MPYTLTLNAIFDSDLKKVGHRALDMAKIFQKKYKTPLSFVVPNVIFDEFMIQTRLQHDVAKVLNTVSFENQGSLENAYKEIKNLFSKASIPAEFLESLRDAYDSLAIRSDEGKPDDLLSEEVPIVNLIISPDYILGTEDIKGVLMNLKGFESFLNGLASCWLSLYSPEAITYRHKRNIKEFNAGVIVQKMIVPKVCAEAYSKGPLGNYEFKVRSYLGLPDILKESSKDVFSISKEYLKIESAKKTLQEYMIIPSQRPNLLIKRFLGSRGQDQSLSDKEVIEVARLTKRMNEVLDVHFKVYYLIFKESIYFFMLNRFPDSKENETQDLSTLQASGEENIVEPSYAEANNSEGNNEKEEKSEFSEEEMFSEPSQEEFKEIRQTQDEHEQMESTHKPISDVQNSVSEEYVEEIPESVEENFSEEVEVSSEDSNFNETNTDNSSNNNQTSPADKEYYKRLISDTVMDVDNEIRRRYIEIFGYFQESMDYDIALERIHEKTGLPDKDDLSKLKDLLYTYDRKENPDVKTITQLLDSAKRFIDG